MIIIQQNSFSITMPRLTISVRSHNQNRKFLHYFRPQTIFSIAGLFVVKHYIIDWSSLRKAPNVLIETPTLQIIFGKYTIPFHPKAAKSQAKIRNKNNIGYVTFNSKLSKRAHSNVLINKNREQLTRIVAAASLDTNKHNIISLFFTHAASQATSAQIADQLTQALQTYKKQQSVPYVENEMIKNLFPFFVPFNFQQWRKYTMLEKKFFDSSIGAYASKNRQSYHVFLSHHFKIINSLSLQELAMDLRDFKTMLQKFNFFLYFANLYYYQQKRMLYCQRSLVKRLKWRTAQSQKYLNFLLSEFGHKNFIEHLGLFEKVLYKYNRRNIIAVA